MGIIARENEDRAALAKGILIEHFDEEIGRASCRERV